MIKKEKGEIGYRSCRKRILSAEVCAGALLIFIQVILRDLTDSPAAKTVLTLTAVLSVLPTADLAAPLIASWKFKSPSGDFYKKTLDYQDRKQTCKILYDLIVTSKTLILPLDAAVICPGSVCVFCSSAKADLEKAHYFLEEVRRGRHLPWEIHIYKNEQKFFEGLESMEDHGDLEKGTLEIEREYIRLFTSLSM